MSTRITRELRKALERATKETGRSLSQEIELRLQRSFNDDARLESTFGGRENYALLRMVAMTMESLQLVLGKSWKDDPYTFEQMLVAVVTVLSTFRPAGEAVAPADLDTSRIPAEEQGVATALGVISQVMAATPIPPLLPKDEHYGKQMKIAARIKQDLGKLSKRLK